jgi:putative transposase
MSIPKRHASIPGAYFITSRTWQSRGLFKTAPPCEVFIETLLKYRDEERYRVHAFVLMPDHFHILMTPAENISLERAVQLIKGGSAHSVREKLSTQFSIWQRGFTDRRIRDANDMEAHRAYIARNPLKRNLALDEREYKWAPASGLYRMDEVSHGLKPLSFAAGRRS